MPQAYKVSHWMLCLCEKAMSLLHSPSLSIHPNQAIDAHKAIQMINRSLDLSSYYACWFIKTP